MEVQQSQTADRDPERQIQIRLRYWLDFVRNAHREEMTLLLRKAKLGKRPRRVGERWEGWNNVVKHQAGQAVAMHVVGQALELPVAQRERMEKFALIHDAEKHMQRKPDDFTAEEQGGLTTTLESMHQETDPTGALRVATNEEFFYRIFERTTGEGIDQKLMNIPQEELLQYYIDGIFLDGEIVPPLERIARTEARRGDLNDDPVRCQRLGMKYWDAERLVAERVEAMICGWLKEKGIVLTAPDQLPAFIRRRMEEEMMRHWQDTHAEAKHE
ncbi:MAG: hypothetical protein WCS85_02745 [Candidatus Peribacteraceae bacterium]|jgi:hypothetical protein